MKHETDEGHQAEGWNRAWQKLHESTLKQQRELAAWLAEHAEEAKKAAEREALDTEMHLKSWRYVERSARSNSYTT